MKRFLGRKWGKLPIGILAVVMALVLATTGIAFAAYNVFTFTTQVTVLESVEATEVQAPGWFWDWHTPEEPAIQQLIYPGMDLGANLPGIGGKYLIHNISPQPVEVTITVTESSGQVEWYGLRGFYSTLTHTGADTCNWDNPICMTNPPIPGESSCTFILGATDYPIGTASADVLDDSSSVMFFVEAKVADDYNTTENNPLDFTLTVDRGH